MSARDHFHHAEMPGHERTHGKAEPPRSVAELPAWRAGAVHAHADGSIASRTPGAPATRATSPQACSVGPQCISHASSPRCCSPPRTPPSRSPARASRKSSHLGHTTLSWLRASSLREADLVAPSNELPKSSLFKPPVNPDIGALAGCAAGAALNHFAAQLRQPYRSPNVQAVKMHAHLPMELTGCGCCSCVSPGHGASSASLSPGQGKGPRPRGTRELQQVTCCSNLFGPSGIDENGAA